MCTNTHEGTNKEYRLNSSQKIPWELEKKEKGYIVVKILFIYEQIIFWIKWKLHINAWKYWLKGKSNLITDVEEDG